MIALDDRANGVLTLQERCAELGKMKPAIPKDVADCEAELLAAGARLDALADAAAAHAGSVSADAAAAGYRSRSNPSLISMVARCEKAERFSLANSQREYARVLVAQYSYLAGRPLDVPKAPDLDRFRNTRESARLRLERCLGLKPKKAI